MDGRGDRKEKREEGEGEAGVSAKEERTEEEMGRDCVL
jgi:hypothetical protein